VFTGRPPRENKVALRCSHYGPDRAVRDSSENFSIPLAIRKKPEFTCNIPIKGCGVPQYIDNKNGRFDRISGILSKAPSSFVEFPLNLAFKINK
jgi:hypothetical protein